MKLHPYLLSFGGWSETPSRTEGGELRFKLHLVPLLLLLGPLHLTHLLLLDTLAQALKSPDSARGGKGSLVYAIVNVIGGGFL